MKNLYLATVGITVCSILPVYGGQNPPPTIQAKLNTTISVSSNPTVQLNIHGGLVSASSVVVEKYTSQVQISTVATAPWPSP